MAIDVPRKYASYVKTAAAVTGLPYNVVAAQISDESGFDPAAVSPAGAEGIAQFEPGTFAGFSATAPDQPASPFNVPDAFYAYSGEMKQLLGEYRGNVRDALAAYNAGSGDLSAGYGYADSILSAAGQGMTLTSSGYSSGTPAPAKGSGFETVLKDAATNALSWLFPGGSTELSQAGAAAAVDQASDTTSALLLIAKPIMQLVDALDWTFHPSHIIRIFAGVGGAALLLTGIHELSRAGSHDSIAALPVGMVLTGLGGVSLFIALHNLPGSVETFPDLVGYLGSEMRTGPATAASGG